MSDKFSEIPKDVIVHIALMLDLPEVISLCLTSKKFNINVCKNNSFWISRLKQDFDVDYRDVGVGDAKKYYDF